MLSVMLVRGQALAREDLSADGVIPDNAVWIDIVSPTGQEDHAVERALGIAIPTREEMQEIEPTSRLYTENGARYMTAALLCRSETPMPAITAVTFILAAHRLITVRYDELRPFSIVASKLARACPANITGEQVLIELLDAIVDRSADILERVSADVDKVSSVIFASQKHFDRTQTYQDILHAIGRHGDITSKARECLVSIIRLVLYLANEADGMRWTEEQRSILKGMQRDAQSLSDHASFLANKITFLLDAMLGLVSIEQNKIIKIFSVVAVILMPPTLVASVYGMNFKHIPELDWPFGYPFALSLMIAAAIVPYVYFKLKKWL